MKSTVWLRIYMSYYIRATVPSSFYSMSYFPSFIFISFPSLSFTFPTLFFPLYLSSWIFSGCKILKFTYFPFHFLSFFCFFLQYFSLGLRLLGRSIELFLTFTCPCIANVFPDYNKQDAMFLDIFISTDALKIQAVPPPIIRSTKLYIQLQVLSTNTTACCYREWDVPSHPR